MEHADAHVQHGLAQPVGEDEQVEPRPKPPLFLSPGEEGMHRSVDLVLGPCGQSGEFTAVDGGWLIVGQQQGRTVTNGAFGDLHP